MIPYRTLGRTGERVSAIGIGDITWASPISRSRRAFESSAPRSTAGSPTAPACSVPFVVVVVGADSRAVYR